jgi:hypothetical protein
MSNDRYNNGVTYNDKWSTPENHGFVDRLNKEFFMRTDCGSDCPLSWAQEVYQLLKELDTKYGIAYQTTTIGGYYFQGGNPFHRIFIQPFKSCFQLFVVNEKWKELAAYSDLKSKPLLEKIKAIPGTFGHGVSYGVRTTFHQARAYVMNLIKRPKIHISQVKEKYGTLRVYYDVRDHNPPDLNEIVQQMIDETEKKLSRKGAYYKIEDK